MLILKRRVHEQLHVYTSDGLIVVSLAESTEGWARIGIDAPQNVKIYREEIDPNTQSTESKR